MSLSYFQFVEQFCTVLTPTGQVQPMVLYSTQRRFSECLYRRDASGRREISRAMYAAPKKTGKTGHIASHILYHFFFGEEVNREIPIFAWDLDQTAHAFNACADMIRRHSQLRKWARIGKHEIEFSDERGRHVIQRLARDEMGSHGGNPSLVVSDETWTLPDWSMASALSFSPLRLDPMMLFTSYAGYESDMHAGRPLYDMWLKLQPGAEPDPSFLGVWMTGDDARREVPWWSERWIQEQARLLASEPWEFARLVENKWASGASTLFSAADVSAITDAAHTATPYDQRGPRRVTFIDVGYTRDHAAIVTVHREPNGIIALDDVWHYVTSKEAPVDFAEMEAYLTRLHLRFRTTMIADQWQSRQMIQRLKGSGLHICEVTVSAAYHDRIARNLIELQSSGGLRLFPHEALLKQLRSVVLKRSSSMGRDDSSVRVRIDSGAGAGVAGKDDIVIALAGAAFELHDRLSRAVTVQAIRVNKPEPPSRAVQALRAAKTARRMAELGYLTPPEVQL